MRIGVDLGGTKIEALLLDADGQTLARERVPTPSGDYQGTLDAIRDLVVALEQPLGCRASVGVCTPGALSPQTGLLRNSNSVCLNGRPLLGDLQRCLQREVRMANDADCFALSEARDGAGRGARSLFGVIIGTGTGGGLVIDGRLLAGPNAIAGEWGHNPLPWPDDTERPGPSCYCGKRGCIETWLSGPGLARDYRQATGEVADARRIAELAEGGEAAAKACMTRYCDRLARALASVINLVDPEVIVLGGGVGNIGALYDAVPRHWGRYVFSDTVATRLVRPVHGDSSGVRGAAWLWPPERVAAAQPSSSR